MKTIYRAENIVDAHLVRNALESVGIAAHVAGEFLTGAVGELPALGLVSVMVADHDAVTAARIAAEIDSDLAEARRQAPGEFEPGAVPG